MAVRKAGIVDIGQDHQLEMLLEIGERVHRVGKGGPVLDRIPVAHRLVPADGYVPFLGEAAIDAGEKIAVALCRCLALLCGFMPGMRLEDHVAIGRGAYAFGNPVGQRTKPVHHAGFPVDQRAVAIESQHLEVR